MNERGRRWNKTKEISTFSSDECELNRKGKLQMNCCFVCIASVHIMSKGVACYLVAHKNIPLDYLTGGIRFDFIAILNIEFGIAANVAKYGEVMTNR